VTERKWTSSDRFLWGGLGKSGYSETEGGGGGPAKGRGRRPDRWVKRGLHCSSKGH